MILVSPLALAIAINYAVPSSVQTSGADVLTNSIQARQAIKTGVITLHETWEIDGHVTRCDATAWFDEQHYRFDVHDHSGFPVEESGAAGRFTDPLRMVFDGKMVLERLVFLGAATFNLRAERDTRVPIINARLLGLPGAPDPQLSVEKRFRTEGKIERLATTASIHTLTLSYPASDSTVGQMDLSVDPDKGWSVVEFTMRHTTTYGANFVIKGFVSPAQFGDHWFPTFVRIEQWRNGCLDWRHETVVSGASLNTALDLDTFTWSGIGIFDGAAVTSYIPGVPSTVFRSDSPTPPPSCNHLQNADRAPGSDR